MRDTRRAYPTVRSSAIFSGIPHSHHVPQRPTSFVTQFSPASSAAPGSEARSGIDDLRPLVEAALRAACDFDDRCPPRLAEAIRYALLAPGKRLRPCLVLMAAEACGGSIDQAMPGAVAYVPQHGQASWRPVPASFNSTWIPHSVFGQWELNDPPR